MRRKPEARAMANPGRYEVDGTDEGGWTVYGPSGEFLALYAEKAHADAHAESQNARLEQDSVLGPAEP